MDFQIIVAFLAAFGGGLIHTGPAQGIQRIEALADRAHQLLKLRVQRPAFLLELLDLHRHGGRRAADARDVQAETASRRGADLYVANCRSCHGMVGEGHIAPPLNLEGLPATEMTPAQQAKLRELVHVGCDLRLHQEELAAFPQRAKAEGHAVRPLAVVVIVV